MYTDVFNMMEASDDDAILPVFCAPVLRINIDLMARW